MRAASPKFSLSEVVRIKSQPPARAYLVGEWGVVSMVGQGLVGSGPKPYPLDMPPEVATNIYAVDCYREAQFPFRYIISWFNEIDLESRGEFDPYCGDEDAETAARREVARAIARKQLHICASGGMCVLTWGIQESEKKLVEGLPHRVLAAGCTDPHIARGDAFAKVFNQEIVKHLLERRP